MPEVCPLARRFAELARRAPARPALLGPEGETLATRSALLDQAEGLAARLRAAELPPGPVVVSLPNSADLLAAFLALRGAGRPVALVDASSPAHELAAGAATVGAPAAVAAPRRLAGAPLAWSSEALAIGTFDHAPVKLPDSTAVLKLTSGSTGAARAVALSARAVAADTVQIMRTMGFGGDDVTLAAIPLTHSYGIGSCLVPLLLAGTPLALPACNLPAALADALAACHVAHFPAVPAMVRALARLPEPRPLPDLRVCLAAGAPLSPRDAADFAVAYGVKVHVFYGSSECGGIAYDRSPGGVHAEGAVGTPMERVRVETVDQSGRPVAAGEEGRVRVRSRAVALGVVPETENRGAVSAGTFLSGDLGRLDQNGRLTLTGRVSELLNVAGKKVHPDEVRRVLEGVPGVVGAVVLGLPDRHRGDLVAAVVAVEPAAGLSVHQLLAACRTRLAPHKVPRRVVLVDELPFSERGKLKRDDLLRLLKHRAH